MKIPLTCIARGGDGRWEAICLDFNIVVQGQSLEEVEALLRGIVLSYVEDALKEDETTRNQLLTRRAPLHVRLSWTLGLMWATLWGNRLDGDGTTVTVPFAVACPA